MLIYLFFLDQISGGAKVSEGWKLPQGCPLPPSVEESQGCLQNSGVGQSVVVTISAAEIQLLLYVSKNDLERWKCEVEKSRVSVDIQKVKHLKNDFTEGSWSKYQGDICPDRDLDCHIRKSQEIYDNKNVNYHGSSDASTVCHENRLRNAKKKSYEFH